MMNNTNKRSTCVVCNCNLLEDIVIIGDQYPSAIYPKTGSNYKSLIKPSSLNLTKCSSSDCGLVQLANKYDLDFVLKNYPYLSGGTATMTDILRDIVKDAEEKIGLTKKDVVLDIGGNDGTLLNLISSPVNKMINIDPSGVNTINNNSNYIQVSEKYSSKEYFKLKLPPPKLIFSVAMFYHLDDPVDFCKQIKKIMSKDSTWCLQMTYLGSMLEHNIYDNIVHEHVAYYSLKSLEFLLERVGLFVHDAKIVKSYGGSLRVFIKKGKPNKLSKSYTNIAKQELSKNVNTVETLERFNDRIALLKNITQDFVNYILDKKSTFWAYGASTKGNMICQFNEISCNHIPVVLDNNEKKIGLMMTGSNIPVKEEEKYMDNLPEYLLILPYYYLEFFIHQIKKRLNKGQQIHLLVPLPYPRLITIKK